MVKAILKDVEEKLKATLAATRHDLASIRTGKASLAILEPVKVDYYMPSHDLGAELLVVHEMDAARAPGAEQPDGPESRSPREEHGRESPLLALAPRRYHRSRRKPSRPPRTGA